MIGYINKQTNKQTNRQLEIKTLQIKCPLYRLEYENTLLRRELYKLSSDSRSEQVKDMLNQLNHLKGMHSKENILHEAFLH